MKHTIKVAKSVNHNASTTLSIKGSVCHCLGGHVVQAGIREYLLCTVTVVGLSTAPRKIRPRTSLMIQRKMK